MVLFNLTLDFAAWCLHCFLLIGTHSPHRHVDSVSSAISKLILMLERYTISDVDSLINYLVSSSFSRFSPKCVLLLIISLITSIVSI